MWLTENKKKNKEHTLLFIWINITLPSIIRFRFPTIYAQLSNNFASLVTWICRICIKLSKLKKCISKAIHCELAKNISVLWQLQETIILRKTPKWLLGVPRSLLLLCSHALQSRIKNWIILPGNFCLPKTKSC